jgi:hypothetical protein
MEGVRMETSPPGGDRLPDPETPEEIVPEPQLPDEVPPSGPDDEGLPDEDEVGA